MPEHPLHCLFAFLTMRDILIALTYIDIYFTGDAVIFAKDGTLVKSLDALALSLAGESFHL